MRHHPIANLEPGRAGKSIRRGCTHSDDLAGQFDSGRLWLAALQLATDHHLPAIQACRMDPYQYLAGPRDRIRKLPYLDSGPAGTGHEHHRAHGFIRP